MQILLELYHARVRMIPALEPSVDGVMNGLWVLLAKTTTQVKASSFNQILLKGMSFKKEDGRGHTCQC